MLIDHRTYTLRPGTLRKHVELYEQFGFGPQKRHCGEPLAWLLPETGDVNAYVHIWVYEDFADRAKKRAALFKDPEWLVYLEKNAAAGYLLTQDKPIYDAGVVRSDKRLSVRSPPERRLDRFDAGAGFRRGDDARFLLHQPVERRLHGVDLVGRHHDRAMAVGMDEVAAVHRHAVNGNGNAEFDDVHIGVRGRNTSRRASGSLRRPARCRGSSRW